MSCRSPSHSYGEPIDAAARHIMTTMPLAYPPLESQAETPSTAPACFQPLDPGIVNASIPAFFIGRDRDGFWLARDAKGETGGIFLFRSSALAFVQRASRPLGCATIFLSERSELDVENQGNRLIAFLRPIVRLVAAVGKRATGAL
jgi:hypothetical protein